MNIKPIDAWCVVGKDGKLIFATIAGEKEWSEDLYLFNHDDHENYRCIGVTIAPKGDKS